jgi:hypothetical protein
VVARNSAAVYEYECAWRFESGKVTSASAATSNPRLASEHRIECEHRPSEENRRLEQNNTHLPIFELGISMGGPKFMQCWATGTPD